MQWVMWNVPQWNVFTVLNELLNSLSLKVHRSRFGLGNNWNMPMLY